MPPTSPVRDRNWKMFQVLKIRIFPLRQFFEETFRKILFYPSKSLGSHGVLAAALKVVWLLVFPLPYYAYMRYSASRALKLAQQNVKTEDFDQCIARYRALLDILPPVPWFSFRRIVLYQFAHVVKDRYDFRGQKADLDTVIEVLREAHDLNCFPGDDAAVLAVANDLGRAIKTLADSTHQSAYLDEAIELFQQAHSMPCLPGDTTHFIAANNLGDALTSRFVREGRLNDLRDAFTILRGLACTTLPHNFDRSAILDNLGNALHASFQRSSSMEELDEMIRHRLEALELRPIDHPSRVVSLNNIANSYRSRFGITGQLADLDQGIAYYSEALRIAGEHPSYRPLCLSNYGDMLRERYGQTGAEDDLEQAITNLQDSVTLNRQYPLPIMNLAHCIGWRFRNTGRMEDINEAIDLYREALSLFHSGHQDRPTCLHALAVTLRWRFDQMGHLDCLDEAIQHLREVLTIYPLDHVHRSNALNSLGNVLERKFSATNQCELLDEQISLHRKALELSPPGHAAHSVSHNNLGNSMVTLFNVTKEVKTIEAAIQHYRTAIASYHPGHVYHTMTLNNLGEALRSHFTASGSIESLRESILYHRTALAMRPIGHPDRSESLFHLALSLVFWVRQSARPYDLGEAADLTEAFVLFESAVDYKFSNAQTRALAAENWAVYARQLGHPSALSAYRKALSMLQRVLTTSPTVEMRHQFMARKTQSLSLPLDAASYAIEIGALEDAIEMLEQGRGLLWSELRDLRTPLDQLYAEDETLAKDFIAISRALEAMSTSPELELLGEGSSTPRTGKSVNPHRDLFGGALLKQKRLLEDWDTILERIRSLPGFGNFLKAIPFATLQTAACEGPIIIINHDQWHSDILILVSNSPPVLISTNPEFYQCTSDLSRRLLTARQENRLESHTYQGALRDVLEGLHELVGQPVLEALRALGVSHQSRIWWCPTSELTSLPFHAMKSEDDEYIMDTYISSYTPTIAALLSARSSLVVPLSEKPQKESSLIVVALPDEGLPGVKKEVKAIQRSKIGGVLVTTLISEEATKCAVIEGLGLHSWAHFACHGVLEPGKPLESSFKLYNNGRLSLRDIMRSHLIKAEFAFLSACHTAERTDDRTPDESLHLAAAMQFCGFKSVVGTMWAMADTDGKEIASKFYDTVIDEEGMQYKRSAKALHDAVKRLRKKNVRLERWVNFVHFGA